MSPRRILYEGDAGLLGDDAGRQLLGRHFEREEADDAAIDGLMGPVGPRPEFIGFGDIEGDIRRKRGLAHAGTARDDHEIGGLQAAELAVEIGEARRDARQAPVALEGLGRHVDGQVRASEKRWKPPS